MAKIPSHCTIDSGRKAFACKLLGQAAIACFTAIAFVKFRAYKYSIVLIHLYLLVMVYCIKRVLLTHWPLGNLNEILDM